MNAKHTPGPKVRSNLAGKKALTAAAPEMLDALYIAVSVITSYGVGGVRLEQIKKVIAKAEGRA